MPTCESEFVDIFKAWKQDVSNNIIYNMIGQWAFRWKDHIYEKDIIDDLCERLESGEESSNKIVEDFIKGVRYEDIRVQFVQCIIENELYVESDSDESEDSTEESDEDEGSDPEK